MEKEFKKLIGKTIDKVEFPEDLEITEGEYTTTRHDDNLVITFSDGTKLKLASWDYEGYSSGIYKEIVAPHH